MIVIATTGTESGLLDCGRIGNAGAVCLCRTGSGVGREREHPTAALSSARRGGVPGAFSADSSQSTASLTCQRKVDGVNHD